MFQILPIYRHEAASLSPFSSSFLSPLFHFLSFKMEPKWSTILPATSIFSSFDDLKWITAEFDHELFTKRPVTVETAIDDNDVKPSKVDPFLGVGDVCSGNIANAADFHNLVSALSLSHTMHSIKKIPLT